MLVVSLIVSKTMQVSVFSRPLIKRSLSTTKLPVSSHKTSPALPPVLNKQVRYISFRLLPAYLINSLIGCQPQNCSIWSKTLNRQYVCSKNWVNSPSPILTPKLKLSGVPRLLVSQELSWAF